MPFLALLGSNLKAVAIVAAIVALGVAAYLLRKSGADAARVEGMIDQLNNVRTQQNVKETVDRADRDKLNELQQPWTRD